MEDIVVRTPLVEQQLHKAIWSLRVGEGCPESAQVWRLPLLDSCLHHLVAEASAHSASIWAYSRLHGSRSLARILNGEHAR